MVLSHAEPVETERRSVSESLQAVLAEDAQAQEPIPPFPASIKVMQNPAQLNWRFLKCSWL